MRSSAETEIFCMSLRYIQRILAYDYMLEKAARREEDMTQRQPS